MKIAITGATGFVGRNLVAVLLEDTAPGSLRVIVRDSTRQQLPAGLEIREADVTRPETLRGVFDGVDAVVHTVAVPTERGASFDLVNVRGTEAVVEEAARAGVRRLVHISALGADPSGPYPFLRSKGRGEVAATSGAVPSVVLRPSVLFGPGDDFFPRLGFTLKFPIVPVPGDGRARFQPLHVLDLGAAIRAALRRDDVLGVHEVGGPAPVTYDELLRETMRGYGKRRPTVHLPVGLMKLPALLMGLVLADPPVTVAQLDLLAVDNSPSRNAIGPVFGVAPRPFDLSYLGELRHKSRQKPR